MRFVRSQTHWSLSKIRSIRDELCRRRDAEPSLRQSDLIDASGGRYLPDIQLADGLRCELRSREWPSSSWMSGKITPAARVDEVRLIVAKVQHPLCATIRRWMDRILDRLPNDLTPTESHPEWPRIPALVRRSSRRQHCG